MSKTSALLLIELIAEGVGVTKSLMELAKRVKAGEKITEVDIQATRSEIDDAITEWDKAKQRREASKLVTNPESESE